MKRYFIFIAAGALALYSCTALEPEKFDSQSNTRATVSIPITSEEVSPEPATKAYLDDTGSGWSYVWEDGDHLGFFQYRIGQLRNQSFAEVEKTPSSTVVNYPASDFNAGDIIYSYLHQPSAEAELAGYGISNDDPTNLYMQIPTIQTTSLEREKYNYNIDYSFRVTNAKVKVNGNTSYEINGSNPVGTTPDPAKLSFKVIGFKSDLTYLTSSNARNFKADAYGNASANVSFGPVSLVNGEYISVANVKVYVDGYENKAANIDVACTVDIKPGLTIAGFTIIPSKLSYNYSVAETSDALVSMSVFEQSDIKSIPVRDCMPVVSKHASISSSHILYPEDIQSSMTMYMLGSVAEFRCYSLDQNIGVGENLMGVIFTTTTPCAGMGTYDLTSEDLNLENMSSNSIQAYDLDGLPIKYGKNNYASLYMVIAPGSYVATVTFITDQNAYIFPASSKVFSRAVMKSLNCDLSNSKCVIVPISQYYSDPSGSYSEDGEEEDL